MTRGNRISRLILACALLGFSVMAQAEERSPNIDDVISEGFKKSDRSYVSFGLALNEFRSIRFVLAEVNVDSDGEITEPFTDTTFPVTAQTYGASVAWGTYITDHFKTELRYGMGVRDDTIEEAMDININYWFNWYMGATYPITDYMSAYALGGISHYDADVTRREIERAFVDPNNLQTTTRRVQPSRLQMEEDLFGTSFSFSWLLGLDFKLTDDWFVAFEYGRLLRDTDTNIKVYQGGAYLRYEY